MRQAADAAPARGEVLMIANDFPPVGGAGVQRSLYFAKYLPAYGWRPTVLTVKEVAYPVKDRTLLDELPPGARIVRTESFELRRLLWLARRLLPRRPTRSGEAPASAAVTLGRWPREIGRALRRWLFVPDDRVLWAPFAVTAAMRVARRTPLRVVFATVPPYAAGVIGHCIARLTGLPLVLDLRDPWTRDPYLPAATRLHSRLNALLESSALRHASRVVVISPQMRRVLLDAYPRLDPAKIRVITNGYDAEAFAGISPLERGDRFVVSYVGSLYAHHRAVLAAFCAAWSLAAAREPEFAARAELELVGRTDAEIADELAQWPRVSSRLLGYLPHHRTTAHVKGAAALLLLIKDLHPEHHLITIPGKLFEYLGAGVPILMIGPDGDAADIVRATGGTVLRQADATAAAEALLGLFRAPGRTVTAGEDGGGHGTGEAIGRYDRRALTGELATVLDEAAS
jgi:glycosyltransferase involved in cell wall biosynthesis